LNLAGSNLYLCTPDRPDLQDFLEAVIEGGVDVVQLRDKDHDDSTLVERGRLAAKVCADHGVPFLLNDRPDLALDIPSAGVHVGQTDPSPALARSILGPSRLVGLSTHAPEELDASRAEPLDYVSAGPVVPTPTKPGRPGTGLDYVTYAVARALRPVFVTGGVTPETIPTLAAAGATCFVVVRYLTGSSHPKASARALRTAIDQALDRILGDRVLGDRVLGDRVLGEGT
jgi:thiamine-phosphate pyrophosphorylase